jgi:threonine aldolase
MPRSNGSTRSSRSPASAGTSAHATQRHPSQPEGVPVVDLRSDTVTRPTPAMRQAMLGAALGDDVLGDDPTVQALEAHTAELLGKDAAVFVPSGTMANQIAIRTHCQPGDEIIADAGSHIIHYETGAPAAISGAMIRPIAGLLGQFSVDHVREAVRAESIHSPRSRLLVLENTHNRGGGSVWHVDAVRRVCEAAWAANLGTHLDGARLWNACAASGRSPAEYAAFFDTVSVCFSKGLGAPVGSAICGGREAMSRARRYRKMLGGGMRQSGVLAAAALHALQHHRDRLSEDHEHARLLSMGLAAIHGLHLAMPVCTNMVFVDLEPSLGSATEFLKRLASRGVLALAMAPQQIRLVTHLDVPASGVQQALEAFAWAAGQATPSRRRTAGTTLATKPRSR